MHRALDRPATEAPESQATRSQQATHRREFLERMAAGAAALAAASAPIAIPFGSAHASGIERAPRASQAPTPGPWSDAWLDKLTGKHKQFFDTLNPSDGFALAFAMYFLNLNHEVYGLGDKDVTVVVGLRHFAMPMALPDEVWEKYRIGEEMLFRDPATGGPSSRNPFLHADGAPVPGSDIPSIMRRGVIFTVCNVALTNLSARMAKHAGASKEAAKAEWTERLLPGMTLVPVGVMAVNLAQEHGCSYCYGG